MDKRKLHMSVLAGVLALALVFGLLTGFMPMKADAATSAELKVQLDALKEQKAGLDSELNNLRSQLSETNSEIERLVMEKNIIDQEIFLLFQQITNINNQIATYSMLVADKQEELTAAEARYAELLEQNRQRIQAMEEKGELSYWSVLFQANSFADLLDRVNMVQEIAASDRRRLDELNQAAQKVAAAKAVLEEEKKGLEEVKASLAQTQEALEVKRQEADALLAELIAQGMEFEALVEASEAAQAQLMQDIANKKYQYDNAIYQEWLATSVPPTTKPLPPSQTEPPKPTNPTDPTDPTEPGETEPEEPDQPQPEEGWIVPINYTVVTSPFGEREAPTAGASTNHLGVDLAAPEGTPIYAARSGTVITATYGNSAGYYVQIDHGDGYRSIYMHMTHFVVSSGQYVKQGQLIGYCGSTGISTGSHLHFGISYNGTYVNPANYIPI
ncbi:MAG: peptidoglycan DD-metalloendopeptidase family protein [Oscillospiraceae bacterium]|nr:peptidoglycan DD-metalloendopeptidase family protein [Oscillospiraceae bacterium]